MTSWACLRRVTKTTISRARGPRRSMIQWPEEEGFVGMAPDKQLGHRISTRRPLQYVEFNFGPSEKRQERGNSLRTSVREDPRLK